MEKLLEEHRVQGYVKNLMLFFIKPFIHLFLPLSKCNVGVWIFAMFFMLGRSNEFPLTLAEAPSVKQTFFYFITSICLFQLSCPQNSVFTLTTIYFLGK